MIRKPADAPPAVRELAATVDFSQFLLIAVVREGRFAMSVRAFEGTVRATSRGGVVELPETPCPYCGGAAPPDEIYEGHDVVRIPHVDGKLLIRSRLPSCACDMRLP